MTVETPALYSASALAKHLNLPEAKVKKAIKEMGLLPAAKKGCCAFYSPEALDRLKSTLK